MIRVLFIGRTNAAWVQRVTEATARDALELDHAILPAEGIRRIDERPPDLVVVVGPESDARLGNLLEGIRSRPVGGLAPVILLSDTAPPPDVEELCDALLPLGARAQELIAAMEDLLELHIQLATAREGRDAPPPIAPAGERLEDPPPIAPAGEKLDEHQIRRKLREVRHENYFVILGVAPPAAPREIREALERLQALFAPLNVPDVLASRWQSELDEIRDALDDAEAVLGDESLREQYAQHHR